MYKNRAFRKLNPISTNCAITKPKLIQYSKRSNILLASILPFFLMQCLNAARESTPKIPQEGIGADWNKNAGATAIKTFTEPKVLEGLEKIAEGAGKNIGAEATKALAGMVTGTAKIAAALAVGNAALGVGEKVAERYFPSEQQKALNAEAQVRTVEAGVKVIEGHTKLLEASVKNLHVSVAVQQTKDDIAFTRCIRLYPKQVRNTHGCPGNCQDLYMALTLAGRRQAADAQLAKVQELDEGSIRRISVENAAIQARALFEEHKNSTRTSTLRLFADSFWSSDIDYEMPKVFMDFVKEVAPLSPKLLARVLSEGLNDKHPHAKTLIAVNLKDENGYPILTKYALR